MHIHPRPLLDDWRMQCPCGARARHAYGVCHKCRARQIWKRRKARVIESSRVSRIFRRFDEAVNA